MITFLLLAFGGFFLYVQREIRRDEAARTRRRMELEEWWANEWRR